MFPSMNNSNYVSNSNCFKDIGTFLSKKSLMKPEMQLTTPRAMQCSAHNFIESFGPNQKSLSLKWLRYGQSYKFHVV